MFALRWARSPRLGHDHDGDDHDDNDDGVALGDTALFKKMNILFE